MSKNELAGTYEQVKQEMCEAFQENDPASEITFLAVDSTLEGQRIESLFLDELINRYPGKLIYLYRYWFYLLIL